jgi:hypothetical protein
LALAASIEAQLFIASPEPILVHLLSVCPVAPGTAELVLKLIQKRSANFINQRVALIVS